MARPKKRPDYIKDSDLGENPFMANVVISVRRMTKANVDGSADLGTRNLLMEITPYTKIFEVPGFKQKMTSLSVRGKEMLLYIIHYIPSGKDWMWINRKDYMKSNGIKSVHTFLGAIKELNSEGYIQSIQNEKDVFWINPYLFYKGSRINKFPHKTDAKWYKKTKEEANQILQTPYLIALTEDDYETK